MRALSITAHAEESLHLDNLDLQDFGPHARCNSEQTLNASVEPDAVNMRLGLLVLTQTSSHGKPHSGIKT